MQLSEVYTSVQGEGPNTGKPITFVRFGGCNLRCKGWGTGVLPDGTEVRGCDTVFAVYPEWRGTWDSIPVSEVLDRIPDSPRMVCITGGEPLIQPSRDLSDLSQKLLGMGYKIDLFTNGSRPLERHPWTQEKEVTVVMDWKLPGSLEGTTFHMPNLEYLQSKDALKFVCKNRFDFDVALEHIQINKNRILDTQIWFGVVWGELAPDTLIDWLSASHIDARVNIQTHKYIWDPEARKV